MRLFDDDKVGCVLDAIAHRIEHHKTEDVKVVDLTLRIEPFTAALAASFDDDVHAMLFSHWRAKVLALECQEVVGPQRLAVFPHADATKTSGVLEHAAISRVKVKQTTDEDGEPDGFRLTFRATIGPLDGKDLAFLQGWLGDEAFVTFNEQQLPLDLEPDDPPDRRSASMH